MNHLQLITSTKREDDGYIYVVAEVWVDAKPLVDFSVFATSLREIVRSLDGDGEYFILTCWCGDAGCAGIRTGIRVSRAEGLVEWDILEPPPERRYTFDAEAYHSAVREGVAKVAQVHAVARRTASETGKQAEPVPNGEEAYFLRNDPAV